MSGARDDARLRELLRPTDASNVPPFEALARRRSPGPLRRSISFTLATVVVAILALVVGQQLAMYRQQRALAPTTASSAASTGTTPSSSPAPLPRPIPQPVTRTSAAAQVAWIDVRSDPEKVIGVDPSGKVVGAIGRQAADGSSRTLLRSADGGELIALDTQTITVYSAGDGSVTRTYTREPADRVVDAAVSPDGRWLAFMGAGAYVQIVDLRSGDTHLSPLAFSTSPSTPGLSGSTGPLVWSTLAFSPDSRRLVTIVNWGGPTRIAVFDMTTTPALAQIATASDGQDGHRFAACEGPGLATRIRPDDRTLVTFCYLDGTVIFTDLLTFDQRVLRTVQPNPFAQGPIFTPDGQLLYLHQYPGVGGDQMQVVDLAARRVLGPHGTPNSVGLPGIFSWLFPIAVAGYTPSTNPVSPDGLRIYSVASNGITVLRVPDLAPVARLADGLRLSEAWISGDGATVYATSEQTAAGPSTLYVMPADGHRPAIAVKMSGVISVFVP